MEFPAVLGANLQEGWARLLLLAQRLPAQVKVPNSYRKLDVTELTPFQQAKVVKTVGKFSD